MQAGPANGVARWAELNSPSDSGEPPDGQRTGSPSDYLANERTLLAWVRTAITLMALGFVVARFGLLLRELSPSGGSRAQTVPSVAPYIGVVLVIGGILLAIIGIVRFLGTRNQLQRGGNYEPGIGGILTMIALVIGAGLALTAYLLVTG